MSLHHSVALYTPMVFVLLHSVLWAHLSGWGRLQSPGTLAANGGGGARWGVVRLTVHPCSQFHLMLFGRLYPGLRVKCQSGALEGRAQWSGGVHHEDRSTSYHLKAPRERGKGRESNRKEGEFRDWDLHCHGARTEQFWKASSCAFQKSKPPPCSAPKSSSTMLISAHK